MPEPDVHIRAYEATDEKLIRFMIAKANFGVLAVANNRGD